MISIQDVGKQVLSGNPLKFYAMVGTEYGIKDKYIQVMRDHYGECIEATSVSAILNMMKTRHIIPLKPTLYVVRYDEEFISSLNESTQPLIKSTNIVGTIVCIYEQTKHSKKLSKYLSEYTVSVDAVSPQFVQKYLHSDFPNLPDRFISLAVKISDNYGHAKQICRGMSAVSVNSLYQLTDINISKIFGYKDTSTENQIRKGVASRNFNYLISVVNTYPDDADRILYSILSTMIELDKILDNSHVNSDIKQYANRWTRPDVYYMFMNTYLELQRLRSASITDSMNSVIYLIALLTFKNIPAPEVMT